jgi:chromate reductase, NAD(P)H dehydrogenase (quinone)
LKILVFLGSTRDSSPPRPPRLGFRVASACVRHLAEHHPGTGVELIDPLDIELGNVFKPHFSYSRNDVPEALDNLARKIESADAYVMVSAEYNHSMSPALSHLLNHFGSSLFSYKPSAIVTYSAGQWGGTRAAVNMRTYLSELGCLPVSAMIHVPKAQEIFSEDGAYAEDVDGSRWDSYLARCLGQLLWWASAASVQRVAADPQSLIGAFKRDPSQRNAP